MTMFKNAKDSRKLSPCDSILDLQDDGDSLQGGEGGGGILGIIRLSVMALEGLVNLGLEPDHTDVLRVA